MYACNLALFLVSSHRTWQDGPPPCVSLCPFGLWPFSFSTLEGQILPKDVSGLTLQFWAPFLKWGVRIEKKRGVGVRWKSPMFGTTSLAAVCGVVQLFGDGPSKCSSMCEFATGVNMSMPGRFPDRCDPTRTRDKKRFGFRKRRAVFLHTFRSVELLCRLRLCTANAGDEAYIVGFDFWSVVCRTFYTREHANNTFDVGSPELHEHAKRLPHGCAKITPRSISLKHQAARLLLRALGIVPPLRRDYGSRFLLNRKTRSINLAWNITATNIMHGEFSWIVTDAHFGALSCAFRFLLVGRRRAPAAGVGVGLLMQLLRCSFDPGGELSSPRQAPVFGLAQRKEGQDKGPGEEEGEVSQRSGACCFYFYFFIYDAWFLMDLPNARYPAVGALHVGWSRDLSTSSHLAGGPLFLFRNLKSGKLFIHVGIRAWALF